MKSRYLLLALTAAALVPVLSGCGSSSGPATQSKGQFKNEADLICEGAGNEQTVKATIYLEQHPKAKEVDLVVPAGIPPLEKEIHDLRKLALPQGQEKETEAWLDEVDRALQSLKEEPSSALSENANSYTKANELAEKIGLVDCARNP